MVQINIDGSAHTGNYRGQCECGSIWHGQGEELTPTTFNPALPIAECVVHLKLNHPRDLLDVRFSSRFQLWLEQYWQLANARKAADIAKRRWAGS